MRLWEAWPGKNRFLFDGFLFWPGRPCPVLATAPLILTIAAAFLVIELPRWPAYVSISICCVFGPVLLTAMVAFAMAVLVDPGVLPRRPLLVHQTLLPEGRKLSRNLVRLYAAEAAARSKTPSRPRKSESRLSSLSACAECGANEESNAELTDSFVRISGPAPYHEVLEDFECGNLSPPVQIRQSPSTDPTSLLGSVSTQSLLVLGSENLERFDDLPLGDRLTTDEASREIVEQFWTDIMADQAISHLRMCRTCKIRRPVRSSHCRFCDNCVLDFDHHCFWVGGCIGARNHSAFVIFVLATTVCSALILAIALLDILYSFGRLISEGRIGFRNWQACASLVFALLLVSLIIVKQAMKPKKGVRGSEKGSLWGSLAGSLRPSNSASTKRVEPAVNGALIGAGIGTVLPFLSVPGFSWEPILLVVMVTPFVVGLIEAATEQVSLVGRGVTVKEATRHTKTRTQFELAKFLEFFTKDAVDYFVAPRLEIGDVPVDVFSSREFSSTSRDGGFEDDNAGPEDACGRMLWDLGNPQALASRQRLSRVVATRRNKPLLSQTTPSERTEMGEERHDAEAEGLLTPRAQAALLAVAPLEGEGL